MILSLTIASFIVSQDVYGGNYKTENHNKFSISVDLISEHDEVNVSMVIQMLQKNASNAQNMIKEVIKTFKDYSVDKDPSTNCLDFAIITDPKLRTKKTIKKLNYIAGRVLNKK
mgnify:CR=1 FL=1